MSQYVRQEKISIRDLKRTRFSANVAYNGVCLWISCPSQMIVPNRVVFSNHM
jgi:hypothetical protein